MKFAFLGYGQQNFEVMSKSQQDAMINDCFTYDAKLMKAGHMIGDGVALQPVRTAKTLRWQNGKVAVTDGPYAETKELLGGVGILEALDMAHAVELMSKHPGLRYGATFEIRPINEEVLQRQATTIAAWQGKGRTVDPRAKRFASMGYINEKGWGSVPQAEIDPMLVQCIAFDQERIKSGQWLNGIALQGSPTARTLRGKGGQVIVTDGPFAETKEILGGIVVLAHNDLAEAVTTLSNHPALAFGVVMELRPIDEEISERWQAHQERSRARQ